MDWHCLICDSALGGRGNWKFRNIDRNSLGSILSLHQRLGHDNRDWFADIADTIERQHRHSGCEHLRPVTPQLSLGTLKLGRTS
jgi:hypothetical protein